MTKHFDVAVGDMLGIIADAAREGRLVLIQARMVHDDSRVAVLGARIRESHDGSAVLHLGIIPFEKTDEEMIRFESPSYMLLQDGTRKAVSGRRVL